MTFKKTEEHAYKLAEIAKQGTSVLININGVNKGIADVEILFSPAGEKKDIKDTPLEERAINAVGYAICELLKSRFPELYCEAANLTAVTSPDLMEPLTGKTKDEFLQSDDFVHNLMGALTSGLGAVGNPFDCDDCKSPAESESPEPKNDTTD